MSDYNFTGVGHPFLIFQNNLSILNGKGDKYFWKYLWNVTQRTLNSFNIKEQRKILRKYDGFPERMFLGKKEGGIYAFYFKRNKKHKIKK